MSIHCQLLTLPQQKIDWENYLASRTESNFLQSANWAIFQQNLGKKTFPITVYQQDQQNPQAQHPQQIGAMLAIKETAKRGNYLAIAGGPLLNWEQIKPEQLQEIVSFLQELTRREQCLFIRFRPQAIDQPSLRALIKACHTVPAPMHLTADLTLQLDLNQEPETLLKLMRKNTRYEINKAQKLGIVVKQSQDLADVKPFYEQQLAVAQKHNFVPFGYDFLYEQFKQFASDQQASFFHAYQDQQLLASAFIIFYHHEAVYHYGISTPANQRLPGSYACQWAAILEAKKRGCQRYNFWGIAPQNELNHRFAGVSLFKRGFGGQEVAYLPAHDIPVQPFYWVTYFFETIRKKARKL